MDNKEIGNRIKARRKELNLTLSDIANVVGVASSTIQRYENGTISQYKLPVLESIAKALNVNPTWLVREDAPMELTLSTKEILISDSNTKMENSLSNLISIKESKLINIFNKLNETGKQEAIKRVSELSEINKYTQTEDKSHLIPFAAHAKEGATKEDYNHDMNIMNNDDEWK